MKKNKSKYEKGTVYYSTVLPYFKNTTLSILEIARETGIPYHGVRKMYKDFQGEIKNKTEL